MDDVFKIYVEQLREGREENIQETLLPDFLEINEQDLAFHSPVELSGTAYLADHELIMRWTVKTEAIMPCIICNEPVKLPIHIKKFYASESLEDIKSGIYNFKNLLRETILLELPHFVECNQGNCLKRSEYAKYLKSPSAHLFDIEGGAQPFADLEWESPFDQKQ